MGSEKTRSVKQAQKESSLLRAISVQICQLILDEPGLSGLYVSRIQLSPEGGMCTVYLYSDGTYQEFNKKLGLLILYKPSLRSVIAQTLPGRYTPDITFRYDELVQKQNELNALFDALKKEGKF